MSADYPENVGASTSHNDKSLHALLQGQLLYLSADCPEMWEPRRLTTTWASTVCYRDSFCICQPIIQKCGSLDVSQPHAVSRLSRKCGNLNVSQPHGPPRSVTETASVSVSRLSRKCGSLDVSQPHGPPRSVTETASVSVSRLSRNVGASTSHNPMGLHTVTETASVPLRAVWLTLSACCHTPALRVSNHQRENVIRLGQGRIHL
jgi:hypothetical protein